jgi:hypothetical protein
MPTKASLASFVLGAFGRLRQNPDGLRRRGVGTRLLAGLRRVLGIWWSRRLRYVGGSRRLARIGSFLPAAHLLVPVVQPRSAFPRLAIPPALIGFPPATSLRLATAAVWGSVFALLSGPVPALVSRLLPLLVFRSKASLIRGPLVATVSRPLAALVPRGASAVVSGPPRRLFGASRSRTCWIRPIPVAVRFAWRLVIGPGVGILAWLRVPPRRPDAPVEARPRVFVPATRPPFRPAGLRLRPGCSPGFLGGSPQPAVGEPPDRSVRVPVGELTEHAHQVRTVTRAECGWGVVDEDRPVREARWHLSVRTRDLQSSIAGSWQSIVEHATIDRSTVDC